MATADVTTFADNIKTLGESIVKLTVLEAKALGDYLEDVHGIKPAAAAAVVAGPAAAAAAGRGRRGRRPSSTWSSNRSAPTRSTSSRLSGAATAFGLKEAKAPVESAPKEVKTALEGRRREAQEELEEAGATVKIK